MQADDPLRSATRVDTVASYGQLRPPVGVAMDPSAADADGMTSIDLDTVSSSPQAAGRPPPGSDDPLAGQLGSSKRRARSKLGDSSSIRMVDAGHCCASIVMLLE